MVPSHACRGGYFASDTLDFSSFFVKPATEMIKLMHIMISMISYMNPQEGIMLNPQERITLNPQEWIMGGKLILRKEMIPHMNPLQMMTITSFPTR